jgi:uncharacterized protein
MLFVLIGGGCVRDSGGKSAALSSASASPSAFGVVRPGTPDDVNIAKARGEGKKLTVDFQPWSDETFEKAKREGKFILVDGSAEWCHWCHVMDETTYSDAEVGKVLSEKFVAIRVDIDARPDIADRYGEWGWPATILLSPDAEELGKFRGYIAKEDLLPLLEGVGSREVINDAETSERAAPRDALPWVFSRTLRDLDGYYDTDHGGWGMRQKAPIGEDAELMIALGEHGNRGELERGLTTLAAERALIDRVFGGMYQYSAGGTWSEPHYEKLMTVQASNLEAYARAYLLTKDPALLADAKDLERYMDTILSGPDGAFYVTQDADVNAHDKSKPFVDGKVFYEADAAGRATLGMPRVDDHEYAYENGLAIAALVKLYEATGEPALLERAKAAADLMLRTHVGSDGRVKHDAQGTRDVAYLADAAALGRGLSLLAKATGNGHYREAALGIARTMDSLFSSEGTPLLYAHSVDDHATGVFARRTTSFDGNVLAARCHAELYRLTGDHAELDRGLAIIGALATPSGLDSRGRMTGGFLLALDELGVGR